MRMVCSRLVFRATKRSLLQRGNQVEIEVLTAAWAGFRGVARIRSQPPPVRRATKLRHGPTSPLCDSPSARPTPGAASWGGSRPCLGVSLGREQERITLFLSGQLPGRSIGAVSVPHLLVEIEESFLDPALVEPLEVTGQLGIVDDPVDRAGEDVRIDGVTVFRA